MMTPLRTLLSLAPVTKIFIRLIAQIAASMATSMATRQATTLTAILIALLIAVPTQARAETARPAYQLGLAFGSPAVGLSFRSVLSEGRTLGIIVGGGVQAQLNFTGDSADGGYYLVGTGVASTIGLVRFGYGYVWRAGDVTFHLEASLNIPVWAKELDGLAGLGNILYLTPLGLGVHYAF